MSISRVKGLIMNGAVLYSSFVISWRMYRQVYNLLALCHAVRNSSSSYSQPCTVGPFTVTSTVTHILLAISRPTQGLPLTLSNKSPNKNFLCADPVALYIFCQVLSSLLYKHLHLKGIYRRTPLSAVYSGPKKNFEKLKKLTVHKFQNARQARTGRNMVKSSSPNTPSTWLIFLCPRTHPSPQTWHRSASSVLAVRISCRVISVFVFRKQ
jgi:hypothetical protein